MNTIKSLFITNDVAALLAGIIVISAVGRAEAQAIDPASGLRLSTAGGLPPEASIDLAYGVQTVVHSLIANHKYDEALQRCLVIRRMNCSNKFVGKTRPWRSNVTALLKVCWFPKENINIAMTRWGATPRENS